MRTFEDYSLQNYGKALVLNLGCGHTNLPEYYGIDLIDVPNVDMIADVTNGIPLPDKSVDMVIARDFLEHIPMGQPNIKIMEEIYRVIKVGGALSFEVPSTDWNNTGAFQDPTHISFWNEKKFQYFMDDQYGENFRALYNIQCFFKPHKLQTYNNQWGVTYVGGVFHKFKD